MKNTNTEFMNILLEYKLTALLEYIDLLNKFWSVLSYATKTKKIFN